MPLAAAKNPKPAITTLVKLETQLCKKRELDPTELAMKYSPVQAIIKAMRS